MTSEDKKTLPRRRVWPIVLLAFLAGAGCGLFGGRLMAAPANPAGSPAVTNAPMAGTNAPAPVQVSPQVQSFSDAFATTAAAMRPIVVRIDTEQKINAMTNVNGQPMSPEAIPPFFRHFFDFGGPEGPDAQGPSIQRGTGSGIVMDKAGDILTNRHVVADAGKITVTLFDGRTFDATVVGRDQQTDVAVIRLKNPPKDLVAASFGDSEQLRVGQWVLAVGSPLGMDQTVTAGIVSGKGRVGRIRMSGDRVRRYIQTDAKINPGNSGGPLVTLQGQVVGINTLINTGPGGAYGFAIPINEARRVATILLKDGRVRYAYLGVYVGDVSKISDDMRKKLGSGLPKQGAFVSQVNTGGPAEKAGLKPGDVITSLDGHPIHDGNDVVDLVTAGKIGQKMKLDYWRGGAHSGEVTLGELPSEPEDQGVGPQTVGVTLQTVTPELAESLGLDKGLQGAAIADVVAGSPAERAGLRAGEVIVAVDQKPVTTAEQAVSALRAARPGGHLLQVRNSKGSRLVVVRPAG